MGVFQDLLKYNVSNNAMESIIKALLLLVLSVSGNFLAETLGCQSQTLLDNMFAKHVLILFMIYFTIDFTQGDEVVNPIVNLKRAIIVWVFFHLFTHLDIGATLVVLLIFASLLFRTEIFHPMVSLM